jgi:hypothetical protein
MPQITHQKKHARKNLTGDERLLDCCIVQYGRKVFDVSEMLDASTILPSDDGGSKHL